MTDSNLLFDSFSVGSNSGLGGSGSLFGGSLGPDRPTPNSMMGTINSNNSSSSSGGSSVIPGAGNLSFNTGIMSNGSSTMNSNSNNSSSSSIIKTSSNLVNPPTSSSSNNNNKSSPIENNSAHPVINNSSSSSGNANNSNGDGGSGSGHSSPRSPSTDLWRSTSASGGGMATLHGLDLSKQPSLSSSSSLTEAEAIKKEAICEEDDNNEVDEEDDSPASAATIGLDLSKPELPSPGTGNYRTGPSPFTNGVHSDPPTPQGTTSHAPSRSISTGSGADNAEEGEGSHGSPFGVDSVLNERTTEAMTNGDSAAPLALSSSLLGVPTDRFLKASSKFPVDPYSAKAFDGGVSPPPPLSLKKYKDPYGLGKPPPLFDHQGPHPPPLPPSSLSEALHKSPTNLTSSKYKDSCIAARLADNTFVKPLDTSSYSKLLEGYGHIARNNNNNNNNTSNNNNTGSKSEPHDSPFSQFPESYAKHIENLANGYKSESSPLNKDGMLFKGEGPPPPPPAGPPPPHSSSSSSSSSSASSIGNFSKSNGIGPSFGVAKSEPVTSSSAHSPGSNSSLPSILNFSTNHLRGMATGEGGLAGYLSSYGMSGPLPGSLSGAGSGSGGDSRGPGGGSSQSGGVSEGGISRASPNNKLACRFCGKTFSQAGYIKAHERLHTGEKPFACSVCGKRFSDPSNWKKHERVHANNKKTPGSGGHVTGLDHSDSKVKHMFIKSMSSLVSSSLQHRLAMRHHAHHHHHHAHHHHEFGAVGPIMCKICGKMFSSQSSLSTHKRIHTGERPYRCRTCGKSFTQIGTLRTHERIHTGEKPYICKVCGRTFAQSGSFRMHERRHMTDSIQRCHICYATFSCWQELQRHMASHPQVTQAILEFEEGNQSLMDRLNSDLGGQLGDGGIGQLGHPDPDGPPGHTLLQGEHRSLAVPPHPRCPPPPLLPESFLLDSEAAAFHVQSRGLYPSPGQLPPFSSILPFRPHPGAPPAFPPTFPSALGLLSSQSLPVTSHADLLTKHPIFGAMNMALGGPQHPHHPPPPPPPPPHHHPGHHPPHHSHPDHLHHNSSGHPHHRNSPHPSHLDGSSNPAAANGTGSGRGSHSDNGTDVVSTTSSGSRRGSTVGDGADAGLGTLGGGGPGSGSAMRTSSRSYSPEEARSDSEPMPGVKDDKDGSSALYGRSLSSDEGLMSPDEENGLSGGHHRNRGDQPRYHKSRKLGSNPGSDDDDMRRHSDNDDDDDNRPDDDDDTDIDDRYASEKGYSSRNRRYSDELDRSKRDMERGRDRDRGEKGPRNRSRSFERDRDRNRRDLLVSRDRKRSHSGSLKGSGSMDYIEEDELLRRDGSHRGSPKLKDPSGDSNSNRTNNDDDFLDPNISINNGSGGGGSSSDAALLRPPKRHIERQNLNTRMIPSSSSRKQRHPMRRFSSAGSEQESPQSSTPSTTIGQHASTPSHLPVSSTTMEATLERSDAELVTFLLKEGSVYKCVHCHMIFEDASLFLLHNGFHAHDEPFRCVVCHHVCKDRIDFNCHLTSHIK